MKWGRHKKDGRPITGVFIAESEINHQGAREVRVIGARGTTGVMAPRSEAVRRWN
jgi:hypothetical protein